MLLQKHSPSPALRPYVRHLWTLRVESADIPLTQQLFPFGSFELIFNIDGAPEMETRSSARFMQSQSLFTGQFTGPFKLHYTKPFYCMGATLHPWAGNIFKTPAQEFSNEVVDLADVIKSEKLLENLVAASGEQEAVRVLDSFLRGRLKEFEADKMCACLAQTIMNTGQCNTALKDIGLSQRRIEQRFINAVGLTLSGFIRKMRFQRSVQLLQEYGDCLGEVGFLAGYYDQPHFNREFRSYAGTSPKEFIRQASVPRKILGTLMES
jgi:AraC-like DNA-binding protein